MKKTAVLCVALAAGTMLAGCTSSESNLRQELDTLTQNVKGRIAPLPVIVPYEPFTYVADSLIDPFAPVKITAKFRINSGLAPDTKRAKAYLESFPLESMKMVGTVKIKNEQYAVLVIDGMTYRIRVGAYIGQNLGRVVAINDGGVTLKEMTQENGDWVEKTSELFLQGTTEGIKK